MSEKILIVDDDIDSLKLIGLTLQRNGYEVLVANAGNQAINKAQNEQPHLIILDVMMPDMDGYEVCRRLRSQDHTKNIPIIMFTAKTMIDDKVAGFEAGADDYLTKPTHPTELISRVKAILHRTNLNTNKNEQSGQVIGIVGAKGGLGTSTLAVNLAMSYTLNGEPAILADFRLGQGSLAQFLGIEQAHNMASLLSKQPAEITTSAISKELITHPSGIKGLFSSTNPKENLLTYTQQAAQTVIKRLKVLGQLSIVDLGSGLTPLVANAHNLFDQIILVVDSAKSTLAIGKDMLKEFDAEKTHLVVVNRMQVANQPPWNVVERMMEHEIRAIITSAPDLAYDAIEEGIPIVSYQPNAIVTNQLNKLAEDIVAEP
jgi:CheY-like chemotaxis protein/MinD-like ATPase involved in chromosome partitioning or flagellar assembly